MWKYIGKRFLIMILSVFLMTLVAFILIELPPGDYVSMTISKLQMSGETVDEARIESLKAQYGYDKPVIVRYGMWIGKILTKGDFGQSFQWKDSVVNVIKSRLPYTILISLSTLLITYIIAIPIGVYSAIKQYSIGDYIVTIIGFIGIAVPGFLLALILMYYMFVGLGISPGGLFSPEMQNAPWSLAKVGDLLQHLIIPVIVTGTAGTASLIRTLRATLLDELTRDYVDTARVKGLSEGKLLAKYPVRIAMNPMISTVGWLLPTIVSGETVVSIVLNLPTMGLVLFTALQSQDVYLAGGIVLILTILTIIGTFLSDILLAYSDPRIRLE